MARATYEDIAVVLKEEFPKFIVCMPEADDECLSVYPPRSFHRDLGIDVWLSGNTAELWMEDIKVNKLKSIQDAAAVARAITKELQDDEDAYLAEVG